MPSRGAPDMHGRIFAGRGQPLLVGRPGNATHDVAMPLIDKDLPTAAGVPDMDGCIVAARGDTFAIG